MMSVEMAQAIVRGGERGVTSLTVLYDERCAFCRRLREWLGNQMTVVPINLLAADSPAAHARFPELDHARSTTVLTVIDSNGAVYEGERAWLVCGWALPRWQPIAEHFGSGLRLRVARLAAEMVDGYRHRLLAQTNACERCGVAAR